MSKQLKDKASKNERLKSSEDTAKDKWKAEYQQMRLLSKDLCALGTLSKQGKIRSTIVGSTITALVGLERSNQLFRPNQYEAIAHWDGLSLSLTQLELVLSFNELPISELVIGPAEGYSKMNKLSERINKFQPMFAKLGVPVQWAYADEYSDSDLESALEVLAAPVPLTWPPEDLEYVYEVDCDEWEALVLK